MGKKAGYGLGEAASCIVITLLSTFGLLYLTDIVKLSPSFAGIITAVGIFFSALISPVIGIFSDNLKTKWGRRRPLILISAIPQSIVVWLFFTNITFANHIFTGAYYLILILACYLFNTLLEIPHLALSAEMTQDSNERTSVMAWRSFMGQIGSVLAGPVIIIMYDWIAKGKGANIAATDSVGFLCILCIPMILISWHSTKGTELFPKKTRFELKDIVTGPLKNRSFIYLTLAFSFAMCVITITGAAGIYYLSYVLKLTDSQVSVVLFILFGLSIVWIPIIDIICTKFSKKIGWTIFMGMWAVAEGIFIQFFLHPGHIVITYIVFFFVGGGITGVCMIGWSMISDCIEIDQFKTGQRREGIYFGLLNFTQKIACAVSMLGIGYLLTAIGYKPGVDQTLNVQNWITGLNGLIGSAILVISIVLCWFVPLTAKRHKALRKAIALKEAGKPYNTTEFDDIL